MFADVSGSTKMYEEMGDEHAKDILDKCLGRVRVITEAHQGIVIKEIGDELMCRFEHAADAIPAAKIAQTEVQAMHIGGGIKLSIRAGIHFGDVIEDDNDIFGDAVNVAARMAGLAKAGQILTTQETVNCLPPEYSSEVRLVDVTRVKGKQEEISVYQVLWEQNTDVTRVATELLSRTVDKTRKLQLKRGEETVVLEDADKTISIGRDRDCDLIVDTALASRKHATCEWRRDKFLILDQGTNGTYVLPQNGEEVYLRREELVLQGRGTISLGKPCAEVDQSSLIHFEC